MKGDLAVETIGKYKQDLLAAQNDKALLAKVRILAYVNGSRATGYTLVVLKDVAAKAIAALEKAKA